MIHLRPFIVSRGRGQHQHSTDRGLSDDNVRSFHSSLHCFKGFMEPVSIYRKLSKIKVKPTKSGVNVSELLMKNQPAYPKTARYIRICCCFEFPFLELVGQMVGQSGVQCGMCADLTLSSQPGRNTLKTLEIHRYSLLGIIRWRSS